MYTNMSLGVSVPDVTDGTRGASKNVRKPDSKADVPVWMSTATRPTWLGGYRTRHSPDRSGAEDRATHHMPNRCTGAASVPRDGKHCVLCQRLPSTTTSGNRPALSKRALIVHAILLDAVLRFRRTGRATGRQAVTSGIGASKPVVGSRRQCWFRHIVQEYIISCLREPYFDCFSLDDPWPFI